ncbi:hypothetical protein [Rhodoligotrophos defluvii]|uniref:hypothetical protein n=1 Tax=Rhodoligotrophos defluvii TaxID=2561934 RepID=UPI0010C95A66|nr:hypothetical protein [Rhodoligotrophos defluvii]
MLASIAAVKAACGTRRALISGAVIGLVSGALLTATLTFDLLSGPRERLSIEKKPEMIIIDPRSRYSGTRIV